MARTAEIPGYILIILPLTVMIVPTLLTGNALLVAPGLLLVSAAMLGIAVVTRRARKRGAPDESPQERALRLKEVGLVTLLAFVAIPIAFSAGMLATGGPKPYPRFRIGSHTFVWSTKQQEAQGLPPE